MTKHQQSGGSDKGDTEAFRRVNGAGTAARRGGGQTDSRNRKIKHQD